MNDGTLEVEDQAGGESERTMLRDVDKVGIDAAELELKLAASPSLLAAPEPVQRLVAVSEEHSLAAEKFRMLANRLASMRGTHDLRVVHVTSSVVGEGKSTVAANLAVTLAQRPNQRVLLLDGDLHRPVLATLFGVVPGPGLGEWWDNRPQDSLPPLYRINDWRLWLLPAGSVSRPVDLLLSPRISALLAAFAKVFDWVVVDSPPLLPLADAAHWARLADGTLLVVRAGVPPRTAMERGLESLDRARLIGVVLNEAPDVERNKYYYQYYGMESALGTGAKNRKRS